MSYDAEKKLTNDDFRKLFMTPRHSGESARDAFAVPATPSASTPSSKDKDRKPKDKEKDEKRRKKKHFYAKIKKEEDDQMAELARKYRDRAKERREGEDPVQRDELISAQGAYRAVAPDFRGNVDAAERRKQLIQESKFLGGDMEHTHLVKGLDYALLQKVRSELDAIGEEGLPEIPDEKDVKEKEVKKEVPVVAEENVEDNETGGFHTKIGRSIHRVLFKTVLPDRNELFAPGRMAYVMDLEDEYAESDIPTTLIRSKADVPNAEGQATLTTNDIVINKLAQILSYLRQGSKSSKKHKRSRDTRLVNKPEEKDQEHKRDEEGIYGDIGDYVPSVTKSKSHHKDKKNEKDGVSRTKRQYFEKPKEDEEVVISKNLLVEGVQKMRDREAWQEGDPSKHQPDQTFGSILKQNDKSMSRAQKLMSKINSQPEGYAECYPGFDEMHDAIEDSDEETDYSKMDPGKKKGAVGRWDFDTQEEYSEYMSNKEALPKAAFQFGVKMNDGRKTRKGNKSEKNEKAQLERQWQQIQAIMHKRKGGKVDGESDSKTPKM